MYEWDVIVYWVGAWVLAQVLPVIGGFFADLLGAMIGAAARF